MHIHDTLTVERIDDLYSQWAASNYSGSWQGFARAILKNEQTSHADRMAEINRKLKSKK